MNSQNGAHLPSPPQNQPIGPGNHDKAWNDPPMFSVQVNALGKPVPTKLNKRVAFPLTNHPISSGSTNSAGTFDFGRQTGYWPSHSNPNVQFSTGFATGFATPVPITFPNTLATPEVPQILEITPAFHTVPYIPHEPPAPVPSDIGSSRVLPVIRIRTPSPSSDTTFLGSSGFTVFELLEECCKKNCDISKQGDLRKRLLILHEMYPNLDVRLRMDLLTLAYNLSDRDWESAEALQYKICCSHTVQCRPWMMAIRHLIGAVKQKAIDKQTRAPGPGVSQL